MTVLHQEEAMCINEDSLKTLIRGITQFQGEFSLILAISNYRTLREQIVQQLREQCPIAIRELMLEQSVQTLYTRIAKELDEEQPDALMIFGLESVCDIDQVLMATNQIREEFRKFTFPLVLWVTDDLLQKLIRLVPDFHSWATTVDFKSSTEELIQLIERTVDGVFTKVLNSRENVFLDNAALNLDLEQGSSPHAELKSARRELQNQGVKLNPELEAGLEFVLARIVKNSQVDSRQHYQQSLALWQQTHNQERCGIVLLHLGLWWRNYAIQHRTEHQQACDRAKEYFRQAIKVFEQANRPDLAAKFINFLAEILHRLKLWGELEVVAKKALSLYQIHSDTFRQARTYGFLAEVALSKSLWTEAKQTAQQALLLLANAARAISNPSPEQTILLDWENSFHQGWYLLSLAKAQQHIGQKEEAITTLESARDRTKPHYDPELYILILKALQESYFQQGKYLTAFHIKQDRQAVESQFGLRAFIGAGRLQPKQQVTNPALPSNEPQDEVAQEIASSGRLHSVERLLERLGRDDCKLTIIHGESGVGKSSIEQAGLIPALKHKPINTRNVLTVLQQVYADWNDELGKCLVNELVNFEKRHLKSSRESEKTNKNKSEIVFNSVEKILKQLRINANHNLLTILIFDQFEEFFFICKDPVKRKEFYDFLLKCLDIPYVKVLLSLREDYLHYLLECTRFSNLEVINNNILDKNILFYLGNFTPEEAKLVIQSLTEKTQFYLEPALIDELVKDLAGKVNEVRPVELQIVGAQLQAENITTLAEYQEKGPKAALVARFLEEVIKDCGAENQQLAELVLWLLTDENSTRPLRTRDDIKNGLQELLIDTNHLNLVLEIFVKSGLVLLLPSSPENLYQLVHDYLANFVRQQKNNELIEELEKEREQRRRSEAELNRVLKRQLKLALGGGIVMAFLAVLAVLFGVTAKIDETNAELREISADSESLFTSRKELEALRRGLNAGEKLEHGFGVEANTRNQVISRLQEVVYGVKERNRLEGHTNTVTHISFSSNGELIASSSEDKTVKIWNRNGKEVQTLKGGHSDGITCVAFSPDGKIVASGSKDKKIVLWNIDGTPIRTLEGHTDWVRDLSFSPDGQKIASASEDKTVKLWSINGTLISTLRHESDVNIVTFSPNSQMIASVSEDRTIKLSNIESKELKTITSPANILSLMFSSDGKMLMAASNDNTLRFWSLDGTLLKTKNYIAYNLPNFASLSSNGKLLIASDSVNQVLLWKIEGIMTTQLKLLFLPNLKSLSFSPDGKTFAFASDDNVIKVQSLNNQNFDIHNDSSKQSKIVGFSSDNLPVSVLNDTFKFWNSNRSLAKTIKLSDDVEISDNLDSVSFSPDSQIMASIGTNTITKLWNRNGSLVKTFNENISFRDFSSDGQLFATITRDNTIKLWKSDGKLIETLQGHHARITEVVFSPNSQLLATASLDNTVKLWNREGKLIQTLQGHRERITEIIFSPDSQLIVTVSRDKTVKLWNREGKLIQTFKNSSEQSDVWREPLKKQIIFSPDSQMLFVPSDYNDVKLLGRNGKVVLPLKGHDGAINSVTFSPNSQIIATADTDGKIRLWRRNDTLINTLEESYFGKGDISFSPDSKLLVSVSRNVVKLWSSDGKLITNMTGNDDTPSISFSPNNQTIASINENSVRLWSRAGKLITTIKNEVNEAPKISVSKDGRLITSVSKNNTVNLWSSDGTLIKALKGHNSQITLVSFNPNGQTLCTVDKDNIVKLWNKDGKLVLTLKGHSNRVERINFSADDKTVAVSGVEDIVKLWNSKGESFVTLKGHRDHINSVSFSPKGQLIASASNDKTVRLWRLDGTQLQVLRGHTNKVNRVRFSFDEQLIASASDDKTVRIWNQQGKLLKTFERHKSAVRDISFSPDSQWIASGSSDSTVILHNLNNDSDYKTLPGHSASVESVSFSPDGQILASADNNSANSNSIVKIWSREGKLLKSFARNSLSGKKVSFSNDGQTIFVWNGYDRQQAWLWSRNPSELLKQGCNQVRDYLKSNPKVNESDRALCDHQ
jgi:WD40 repeat protein/tetratricopeptide (TPR) repeat protein